MIGGVVRRAERCGKRRGTNYTNLTKKIKYNKKKSLLRREKGLLSQPSTTINQN